MNKIFKMKRIILLSIIVLLLFSTRKIVAQEVKKLTLEEVIKIAEEQSPNALMAKHRFRTSYWQYRSFVAQYLPSLTFRATLPSYSKGYTSQWNSITETYKFNYKESIQNIGTLSLRQNIGLTGGSLALSSDLRQDYDFNKEVRNYTTTPIKITLNQPLFQANTLKWQRKTEPLRYEAARKTYLTSMEAVHSSAVQNFFSLASAQINVGIAEMNYTNNNELYIIAKGRYELGTIAEGDVLQMELNLLNAETARKEADMNLRDREIRLRSFLGYNDNVRLELIIPTEVPYLQVDMKEVLDLAMANNPEILTQDLNVLNAQSSLAQAKARGRDATLTASYGTGDNASDFSQVYNYPSVSSGVSLGITMPILDWGLNRGKYKMAVSSYELAQVQAQQARQDFQQNLFLDVERFNLQRYQVEIAAKSDTVARKMFEVTRQRFLIGKITVLDLNNADTKKDQNKRAYLSAVQTYWSYFYNIRSLTLFDFINRKPLEADYEKLIK
jgi:outer membrane protein TolC